MISKVSPPPRLSPSKVRPFPKSPRPTGKSSDPLEASLPLLLSPPSTLVRPHPFPLLFRFPFLRET